MPNAEGQHFSYNATHNIMTIQYIFVFIILIIVIAYIIQRIVTTFKEAKSGCYGCKGCALKGKIKNKRMKDIGKSKKFECFEEKV